MVTLAQALQKAIESEESSYRLYSEAAETTEAKHLKTLFQRLAKEELKHKAMLSNLKKNAQPDVHLALNWLQLNLNDDTLLNFERQKGIVKILEFAMAKELRSQERYTGMAKGAQDKKTQDMCGSLALMESGHHSALKAEYDRLIIQPK